jgi:hypothetical protein
MIIIYQELVSATVIEALSIARKNGEWFEHHVRIV